MGFFVSDQFASTSDSVQKWIQYIVIIAIPCVIVPLFIILASIFVYCCIYGRCDGLHTRVTGLAKHIFYFLKNDKERFIVYGYKAPVSYTYNLLFVFFIICIHTFLTFWDNAFHNSYNNSIKHLDPVYRNTYCIDIFNITQSQGLPELDDTENLTCIEIHLLEGLESAATTFGLSALAVAIMTWVLLTCSKGNRVKEHKTKRLLCCIPIIIILQILCLFGPCAMFMLYLAELTFIDKHWSYGNITDPPIPAITDVGSLFICIAILDAISLTMLTPWSFFVKWDGKNKSNPRVENDQIQ